MKWWDKYYNVRNECEIIKKKKDKYDEYDVQRRAIQKLVNTKFVLGNLDIIFDYLYDSDAHMELQQKIEKKEKFSEAELENLYSDV